MAMDEYERYVYETLTNIGMSIALRWWTSMAQRTRF